MCACDTITNTRGDCMICKDCKQDSPESEMKGKGKLYCDKCFVKRREFIKGRKYNLELLKALPLEVKIAKSKLLLMEAFNRYGSGVYVSYSGGKDSTVLSHLARCIKPDILHIFSNTTCEYPETLKQIMWEKEYNNMNLITVRPFDKYGKPWNFKRVVNDQGFPMFSKAVANSIRTYRRAKTEQTRQNSIDYITRRFKRFLEYKDINISDKCCEKLKKTPIKQIAKKLGMECAILGTLAEESRQREMDWVNFGCNVFDIKKDNQCRPLSFWTEKDIYDYIELYGLKISDLYLMGYTRNGCMFCGFGIEYDLCDGKNRFERLAQTHPKSYKYLIDNFKDILDSCGIKY